MSSIFLFAAIGEKAWVGKIVRKRRLNWAGRWKRLVGSWRINGNLFPSAFRSVGLEHTIRAEGRAKQDKVSLRCEGRCIFRRYPHHIALSLILGLSAFAGCTREHHAAATQPSLVPTTRPTGLTHDQLADIVARRVSGFRQFHASWGETLTLMRGGSYFITSRGCEGSYGVAVGHWRLVADTIELTPEDEEGITNDKPLRILHVRLRSDAYQEPILIPDFAFRRAQGQNLRYDDYFEDYDRFMLRFQ